MIGVVRVLVLSSVFQREPVLHASLWRLRPEKLWLGGGRVALVICWLALVCMVGHAEAARLPNIVIIVADDLGYGELGCQGNSQIPTPHIDGLAAEGVRFTQAYVTAPNCSPSRAGLFSGRTPTRFGYEFNPIGARNEDPAAGIPHRELLLPEFLREQGYICGLVGKWHLGGAADFHPLRHGFDSFFGFLHEGHYFEPAPWANTTLLLRRKKLPDAWESPYKAAEGRYYGDHMQHDEPAYDANNPILRDGQPIEESEYLTDAFAREADAFILQNAETPFFLALTFNAVHSPLQARRDTLVELSHIADLQRRIFAAMLVDLDRAVGRVLASLQRNNVAGDTLVFFLSDNGGPTRELTSSNLPLRDGKGSMYEGGLRVPMIARFPPRIKAGSVCSSVVSSLDIYATCAQLLGSKPDQQLEGESLFDLLAEAEGSPQTRELVWRQGGRAALRKGSYKIVASQRRAQDRQWELYNIDNDIGETNDLSLVEPDKVRTMVERFQTLESKLAEPLF